MKILFDCGACVGDFLKNYLDYEVHAFEPYPINFQKLKEVYGGKDNIYLYNAALSDSDEVVKLFYGGPDYNKQGYVGASICRSNSCIGPDFVSSKSIRLSNFIQSFSTNIDILKLDIEGAEYFVLQDLIQNNLINRFNTMYIEFHAEACRMGALKPIELAVKEHLLKNYSGELYFWGWSERKWVKEKN